MPDNRNPLWAELEKKIQDRANKKDNGLRLNGDWKKFIREQEGFKVFAVDGEWVRNNLSIIFGHGGHGYVHEFIPLDEVWTDTHHREDCGCKVREKNQKVSQNYFDSTTIHEITEFKEMEKGMCYYDAHQIALQKESEIKLLEDPFDDTK